MSFSRNKFIPPKKIIITSNNNIQQQEKSLKMYQKYGKRLINIESNLNTICSQHDALMPLLSLLQTMPQLSKAQQQLRISLKKINELQNKLQKLQKTYNESKNKQLLNGVESSFGNVSKNLMQCKQGVNMLQRNYNSFSAKYNEQSLINNESLTKQIQQRNEIHKKQIQNMLAQFKNQMQIRYKKNLQLIKITKTPKSNINFSEIFPKSPFLPFQQQIKNIYREIGMIKLELPLNNLLQFHNYNFSRINYEFYEIEEIMDRIYDENTKMNKQDQLKQIQAYQSLQKFQERVQWLGYQIKGLRKKYLIEFNQLVDNQGNKNEFESKFTKDLQILDIKFDNLTKKLLALREHYQPLIQKLGSIKDIQIGSVKKIQELFQN